MGSEGCYRWEQGSDSGKEADCGLSEVEAELAGPSCCSSEVEAEFTAQSCYSSVPVSPPRKVPFSSSMLARESGKGTQTFQQFVGCNMGKAGQVWLCTNMKY